MKIKEKVEKFNKEIANLENKRHNTIKRYVLDNGLKDVLQNIRKTKIPCKIKSFNFENNDDFYVIHLELPKTIKDFKTRLKTKHMIVDEAFKGIDDDFIVSHIMIVGVI